MDDMTPEQWRDKLITELNSRRIDIRKLRQYYDGDHVLPSTADTTTDEYKRLAVLGQANLCANVVDAVTDRLEVTGINIAGEGDIDAGLEVWRDNLQPNRIDAEMPTVFEESVKVGRSFMLVWPMADAPPSVTPEDPAECIVAYVAGSRRERVAGLKVYRDDEGTEFATLWLAETVHFWQSKGRAARGTPKTSAVSAYLWLPWDGPAGQGSEQPNPMGKVPLVEFRSKPKIDGCPQPELSKPVRITQDRINFRLFNSIVVGEYQSFPQRVAIGIEIPTNAAGEETNPLKAGPERVWTLNKDPDSDQAPQVLQLDAADLAQHIAVVQSEVKMLAAQSKTPLYQLAGDLINVSADTISALEVGLVKKVKRHQKEFGECIEEVVQLVLVAANRPDLAELALHAEVTWADPELVTLAQRADAATKLNSLDYPFEAIARIMGETKVGIAQLQSQRASSRLLGAIQAQQGAMDPEEMKKRVDTMGVLIRAGVKPESAAAKVGLDDVEFIEGATSTSIVVPNAVAG